MPLPALRCPLCHTDGAAPHLQDRRRTYYLCPCCALLFVAPEAYLSAEDEKREYDLHENDPNDPAYRRFLHQLFAPLQERLPPGSHGLDFGSGPGPTLSVMLEEAGHTVALYDAFYTPDVSVFSQRYDFISASEVVEHLHHPRAELERLWSCLRPGGLLGIMTQLWSEQPSFQRWRYKDDLTHVCFFARTSFVWLAHQWDATLHEIDRNVRILQKPE